MENWLPRTVSASQGGVTDNGKVGWKFVQIEDMVLSSSDLEILCITMYYLNT